MKEKLVKFTKSLKEKFTWKVFIAFITVLLIIFSIDFGTKYAYFDAARVGEITSGSDHSFLKIVPLPHDNSTIFSALKFEIPLWAHFLINFSLAIIFTIPILFSGSIFFAIAGGVLVAGILGNTLDKAVTTNSLNYRGEIYRNYVRDWANLPWINNGVFNLADAFIVMGASLVVVQIIISGIMDFIKEKERKKISK